MKKWICLLLVVLIACPFSGCSWTSEPVVSEMKEIDPEDILYLDNGTIGSKPTTTTEPTTTTTQVPRPLSERIVCWDCCFTSAMRGRIVEMETAELYKELDELKCCVCGAVDGKDYKAGSSIYVLKE